MRAHEAAHQAAGGQYAGAMSFTYQRGPDGAQYAVGGEVPIDVSPVAGDPQATIEKMRVVRSAAMAPAGEDGVISTRFPAPVTGYCHDNDRSQFARRGWCWWVAKEE